LGADTLGGRTRSVVELAESSMGAFIPMLLLLIITDEQLAVILEMFDVVKTALTVTV